MKRTDRKQKRRAAIRRRRQIKVTASMIVITMTAAGFTSMTKSIPAEAGQETQKCSFWEEIPTSISGTSADPITVFEMDPAKAAGPEQNFILPVSMDPAEQEQIFQICEDGGVSYPLVMALIEHESSFDKKARSSTGDSGLMQINDCNAASLAKMGYEDLFTLEDNVGAGVYILSQLINKYDDVNFSLMAYNAGENGAKSMIRRGITSTQYSREIAARSEEFNQILSGK